MALIAFLVVSVVGLQAQLSFAQSDDEMELTRAIISAENKLIVTRNMGLSEQEKVKFWPIYEHYQQALAKVDARTTELLTEYAENYNDLSNEVAKRLLDAAFHIDQDRLTLQREYLKKFAAVFSPRQVARYYQIEHKLFAGVSYQLAKVIPLVK